MRLSERILERSADLDLSVEAAGGPPAATEEA
jgi:hypothetical protein